MHINSPIHRERVSAVEVSTGLVEADGVHACTAAALEHHQLPFEFVDSGKREFTGKQRKHEPL